MTQIAEAIDYAVWQRDATQRWIERSGPQYTQMEIKIVLVKKDRIVAKFMGDAFSPIREHMSLASWLMCREARPGDTLTLLIRCDSLAMGDLR